MRTLVFLLLPTCVFSQNLVANPSFEELNPKAIFKDCSYVQESIQFGYFLKDWTTVANRTPDVIARRDSLISCFYPKPRTGKVMAGFINYLPNYDIADDLDYHEYLQGKLTKRLEIGKEYKIEFWLLNSDTVAREHMKSTYDRDTPVMPLASNNIGIYFLLYKLQGSKYIHNAHIKPHFNVEKVISTTAEEWYKVETIFKADKNYTYFLIGNFFTDEETAIDKKAAAGAILEENTKENYTPVKKRTKRIAYYCIDDISITPVNREEEKITITESTPYTFEKVLFNTGKWALLPGAEEELTLLANYIQQYPDKYFEIGGHTDNVGDAAANQVLSEKRAKTVYDYLLQLGINNKQLSYKGYGETVPKVSNEEAAGRQQNRRVECKILY